ncbi:MAG TPA: DinB family protein [Candidatus Methylomirabilis sp.]|nr:DinB family protein [Candidatus Methylomirabilis sp.]
MANEITAENAMSMLQTMLLPALKNESRTTKTVLDAVPADKSDHRPDPVSKSAIELVKHIALADLRFIEMVLTGTFNADMTLPENLKTPAQIANWYSERFAKDFEALSKISGDQLAKVLDFRGRLQMPAISFLMLGLRHTIHHRGQLSSYLRCMGAKVPAIYGESYDSEQAKRAAQA